MSKKVSMHPVQTRAGFRSFTTKLHETASFGALSLCLETGRKEAVTGTYLVTSFIAGYTVLIVGDTVRVLRGESLIARETVKGLSAFAQHAKDFRTGWARFPDFEVIYLYDKGDENFGYAVNLADPWLSEWGYAPFSTEEQEK